MKHKLINAYTINLIIILAVSFGVSGSIYFTPQNTTILPITPFMSYYNKFYYTQSDDGTLGAIETGTAISIVWLSNIINSTTIEISESEIETVLTIPVNFTGIRTYQVNLMTGNTNNSHDNFIYWTLPYWHLANLPSDEPLPLTIGNTTAIATYEQNMLILNLIRNTKVAWSFTNNSIHIANYDSYSGALIQYMGRTGKTVEIYQLQSTLGINLGIDYGYYALMVLLFSLIPGLIIYLTVLALNLRKKPHKERVRPHERKEGSKKNEESLKNIPNLEEK